MNKNKMDENGFVIKDGFSKVVSSVLKMIVVLLLALGSFKAEAQWNGTTPTAVTNVPPGGFVAVKFVIEGSSTYTAPPWSSPNSTPIINSYALGLPQIVWQGTAIPGVIAAVSSPVAQILTYKNYPIVEPGYGTVLYSGSVIANADGDVVLDLDMYIPLNAVPGSTYQGTVYEPLAGGLIGPAVQCGAFVIKVASPRLAQPN